MKARFKFDSGDRATDHVVSEFPHFLRKGDVLVFKRRYYEVDASQYDLDTNEMSFWLAPSNDVHPTAPDV